MLVFIGTQQDGDGHGIVAARLDPDSGAISTVGTAATVKRPTWVQADAQRSVLFSVSEVGNAGDSMAEVLSFAVDVPAGSLRLISRASSGGGGATHLALDLRGDHLFVANFGGGEAAVLPVAENGKLHQPVAIRKGYGSGPHRRQTGPHAHGVTLDPSGQWLLVPDMGADRVFIYRFDPSTGALTEGEPAFAQLPPGSGPRLVLFSRDGQFAYLLTELSAEIFVYRWNPDEGRVDEIGCVGLDGDDIVENRSAAAFAMSEDGRFLYASNRRTASLHVFGINPQSGRLTEIQQIASGGERPWSAELAPGGHWLVVANQASNNVRVFEVDIDTGILSATDEGIEVLAPTGIAFFADV